MSALVIIALLVIGLERCLRWLLYLAWGAALRWARPRAEAPREVESTAIDLVLRLGAPPDTGAAIVKRTELGRTRYGRPLITHNGRDALQDADEELLDGMQYVTQAYMEGRLSGWATLQALGGLVSARKAIAGARR